MSIHLLRLDQRSHTTRTRRGLVLLALLGLLGAGVSGPAEAARAAKKKTRKAAPVAAAVVFEEPETPVPAPAGSSPMAELKKSHGKLQKLLTKKSPDWSPEAAARNNEVRKLVSEFLDFKELAKRALARNWEPLTSAQKTEFVDTLRTLVERSYVSQMHGEANYQLDWEKETVQATDANVGAALHTTRKGKKLDVSLEYKMLHKPRGWVVYDVVTDEQSLLETYRAEFAKIIKKESFAALLERMKAKLDKVETAKK